MQLFYLTLPYVLSMPLLLLRMINFDGRFQPLSLHAGWEIVVYSSCGHLCAANNGYIAECEDGEVAKLEALRHVLLFATARKLSNVLFVSDCINVVKFIEGNNECILSTNFLLVLKCRILFNQLLNYSADIMWVFMKCNVVAHTLACNGRKIMCTSSVI